MPQPKDTTSATSEPRGPLAVDPISLADLTDRMMAQVRDNFAQADYMLAMERANREKRDALVRELVKAAHALATEVTYAPYYHNRQVVAARLSQVNLALAALPADLRGETEVRNG